MLANQIAVRRFAEVAHSGCWWRGRVKKIIVSVRNSPTGSSKSLGKHERKFIMQVGC